MSAIAVVGSINMDLVATMDARPKKGETVLGNEFFMSPGGKGANQAVAAARLGAQVSMFGSVGEDMNGENLLKNLEAEKIITRFVKKATGIATGVAMIELCNGDNSIVVVQGANKLTDITYLESIKKELLEFDVVILQMEIPRSAVEFLVDYLYEHHKTIILNPAPPVVLSSSMIEKITYLTPNEHEYKIILNTEDSIETALRKLPNKLIITNGEAGIKYYDGGNLVTIPSIPVEAVDTTGAGDTFSGAFAAFLAEGSNLHDSIRMANIAAGISVTRRGAQSGMPKREEVMKLLMTP